MPLPVPRSRAQILQEMVTTFSSRFGIKGLIAGSPLLAAFVAASQSDLRSSKDILDLLSSISLTNAKGAALDEIGAEEGLPRLGAAASTGTVNIGDSTFSPIRTRLYQGSGAAVVGATAIFVVDTTNWPASGRVFIGRGQSNYEGPLAYSSITDMGGYYRLNLTDTVRKSHNAGEIVTLGQGGYRVVGAGSVAQTPQGNYVDAIRFATVFGATLPDGENLMTGVRVRATTKSSNTNAPKGSVTAWVNAPFTGATVTNPLPFTNGREPEKDDAYRERIRRARQSKALGTELAIQTFTYGVTSDIENKTVTGVTTVVGRGYTDVYVDDGTGYEPLSQGQATETVIERAIGGETTLQLLHKPLTQAQLVTGGSAPFAVTPFQTLELKVGGVVSRHTFLSTEFRDISVATAYEVAASINADSALLFRASTTNGGTQVLLRAKSETNDDLEVISGNEGLLFPTGRQETLRLYKNDVQLLKDGRKAMLTSLPVASWSVASGGTLVLSVDDTPDQTIAVTDVDFINANTGFAGVGMNDIPSWAKVLNGKVPGVTFEEVDGLLAMTSNKGADDGASIAVRPTSTLSIFAVDTAVGFGADFTLNRGRGQVRLTAPLVAGDKITAGTSALYGFIESSAVGALTVAAGGARFYFTVDGASELLATSSVQGSPRTINSFYNGTADGNFVTVTGTFPGGFTANDYALILDADATDYRGVHRVVSGNSSVLGVIQKTVTGPHFDGVAATMGDGNVLVAGGSVTSTDAQAGGLQNGSSTAVAEVYYPVDNAWLEVASMHTPRSGAAAVTLGDGRVMVIGGVNYSGLDGIEAVTTAEIYDPGTDTWTVTAAEPLTAGQTLNKVFAGVVDYGSGERVVVIHGTEVDIYNPGTDTWTEAASVAPISFDGTTDCAAIIGASGSQKVAVVKGTGSRVYDPATDVWGSNVVTGTARDGATLTRMADGRVFLAGGGVKACLVGVGSPITWSAVTGLLSSNLKEQAAVLMGDGTILLAGGVYLSSGIYTAVYDTYVFDAGANTITQTVGLGITRAKVLAAAVTNGAVLVGGHGSYPSGAPSQTFTLSSAERYDTTGPSTDGTGMAAPVSGVWSRGMVLVRSKTPPQEVIVPAGSYSYASFAAAVNAQLKGGEAAPYRNSSIRISDNTLEVDGEIAIVAMDANAAALNLGLSQKWAQANEVAGRGSLRSRSVLSTPSFFSPLLTVASANAIELASTSLGSYDSRDNVTGLSVQDTVLSIRSVSDTFNQGEDSSLVFGDAAGRSTQLKKRVTATSFEPRTAIGGVVVGNDFSMAMAPWAIGPNDTLDLTLDQDQQTRRFSIPMSVKVRPSGAYSASGLVLQAADGSSLAQRFGTNFDWSDFALYTQARGELLDVAGIQVRAKVPGIGSEQLTVRLLAPLAPETNVSSLVDDTRGHVFIYLGGDVLKTGYNFPAGSKVGLTFDPSASSGYAAVLAHLHASLATRRLRLHVSGATGTTTGNITGATSGATGVVVSFTSGIVTLSSNSLSFLDGETINFAGGGSAVVDSQDWYTSLTLTSPTADAVLSAQVACWPQGTSFFLNASSPNFSSGTYLIDVRGGDKAISFIDPTPGYVTAEADIGDLSGGSEFATFITGSGTAVAVGDFIRFSGTNSYSTGFWTGWGMRVDAVGADAVYGQVLRDDVGYSPLSSSTNWTTVSDPSGVLVFPTSTLTYAQVVAGINADADCPVLASTAAPSTNIFTGITFGHSSWNVLKDGFNAISVNTFPGSPSTDVTFDLKEQVDASLLWDSTVDVWLVPQHPSTVKSWLENPATSVLSDFATVKTTANGSIEIVTKTDGSLGSVSVDGGTAEIASGNIEGSVVNGTITVPNGAGIFGNDWLKLQNSVVIPRGTLPSGLVLNSWSNAGVLAFNSNIYSAASNFGASAIPFVVQKVGDYVLYWSPTVCPASIFAGDSIHLTPAAVVGSYPEGSAVNGGPFTVIAAAGGANGAGWGFWVENDKAVQEAAGFIVDYCLNPSLPAPGDQLKIDSNIWGANNVGTWTVKSIDTATGNITVDVSDRAPTPVTSPSAAMGSAPSVRFIASGLESYLVKVTCRRDTTTGSVLTVVAPQIELPLSNFIQSAQNTGFDRIAARVGEFANTVVTASNKLGFGDTVDFGADSYRYNIGLLDEVNRTLFGDPDDRARYPGVVSAGTEARLWGSDILRVQVVLGLRLRDNADRKGVTAAVQSAVAAAIAAVPASTPVPIGVIIGAAQRISGVVAASPLAPVFTTESDVIPVPIGMKAAVLDPATDVGVIFVGD